MSDISKKLRDEILARAASNEQSTQKELLLSSTSAALVETTTLDNSQVEAVRRSIEEETKPRASGLISSLPAVNSQYIR
ncbi:MAG: hypothetical protein AAF404_06890, partial [Pseudomonadota bacterium]